jgi:hypothetical protein
VTTPLNLFRDFAQQPNHLKVARRNVPASGRFVQAPFEPRGRYNFPERVQYFQSNSDHQLVAPEIYVSAFTHGNDLPWNLWNTIELFVYYKAEYSMPVNI